MADDRRERSKIYYQHDKDIILQKAKEYRDAHKEERTIYDREYRATHPDQKKETIQCNICGDSTLRHHLARHKRSNKCIAMASK